MKTMAMKKVKVGSSDYTNSLAVALMDGGGLILNLEETTMKFWYITDYKELEKPDFHKNPRIFFGFQLGKRNSKAKSSRTDKISLFHPPFNGTETTKVWKPILNMVAQDRQPTELLTAQNY